MKTHGERNRIAQHLARLEALGITMIHQYHIIVLLAGSDNHTASVSDITFATEVKAATTKTRMLTLENLRIAQPTSETRASWQLTDKVLDVLNGD